VVTFGEPGVGLTGPGACVGEWGGVGDHIDARLRVVVSPAFLQDKVAEMP
jgi:hypothetical protein